MSPKGPSCNSPDRQVGGQRRQQKDRGPKGAGTRQRHAGPSDLIKSFLLPSPRPYGRPKPKRVSGLQFCDSKALAARSFNNNSGE